MAGELILDAADETDGEAPRRLLAAPGDEAPAAARKLLRSGAGPWRQHGVRLPSEVVTRDITCDVVVVGSGITGSLVAETLSRQGLSVVVVDRFDSGTGSTAASTAMLLWEIDTPLSDLSERIGFERASAVYKRSHAAVADLATLVAETAIRCDFAPRASLYVTGAESSRDDLASEFALRERAGLPGRFLERGRLADDFEIDRAAAILSPGSAEADPVLLANGLLQLALRNGARLIEDQVVAYDWDSRAAHVRLAGGAGIEARQIVLATGYTMPDFVVSSLHQIASTWCFSTEPMPEDRHWQGKVLIWEDSEPYLYTRSGPAGQLIVGGEDQTTTGLAMRDALTEAKIASLVAKMQALWPRAPYDIANVWSAEFGETEDGLPLIGRVPGAPRCLAAYGYGGNGITFSYMASRIIAALIAGETRPWFDEFALDRA